MQNKSKLLYVSIIHYVLMFSVLFFLIIVYYTLQQPSLNFVFDNVIDYIPLVYAIVMVVVHNFLYQKEVSKLNANLTAQEKWVKFQTAHLIRMALLEGAALFNVVFFLISNNLVFFYTALILAFVMFLRRPSVSQITTDWQMTDDEVHNS